MSMQWPPACKLPCGPAALLPSMNVFFYLDRRRAVLATVAILTVLNIVLTLVSLQMGAAYYGYGYGLTLCSAQLC